MSHNKESKMPLCKCKLDVGYEGYNGYDKEATWEATIEASDDLEVRVGDWIHDSSVPTSDENQ